MATAWAGSPSHPLFALLLGCCLISWDASNFTACCSGAGDNPRFLNGLLSTEGCAHTVCSHSSSSLAQRRLSWLSGWQSCGRDTSLPNPQTTVGQPLLCCPPRIPVQSVLAVLVLVKCLAWCHSPPPRPSHYSISNKFPGNIPHLQQILAVKMNLICWQCLSYNKPALHGCRCQNHLEKGKTKWDYCFSPVASALTYLYKFGAGTASLLIIIWLRNK